MDVPSVYRTLYLTLIVAVTMSYPKTQTRKAKLLSYSQETILRNSDSESSISASQHSLQEAIWLKNEGDR